MKLGLNDKVVLVTGSSRGIGRATAIEFAREGSKVVINYQSNRQAAEKAAAAVEENGGQALLIQADISNQSEVKSMVDTVVTKWGSIDILINNAAKRLFSPGEPIEQMDFDLLRDLDKIGILGTFYCIGSCVPHMKKRGWGRIVNLTGVFGTYGVALRASHCVTAAGRIAIVKALAKELGPHGILVNAVNPMLVKTEDVMEAVPTEVREMWAKNCPLGRIPEMDEVARVVVFLGSEANTFLNGVVVDITGGRGDWF